MVTRLVEMEHDPLKIAATALKIARGEEKQRPIAPISEVREGRPQKARPEIKRGKQGNGRNGAHGSCEKGNGATDS